jgi:oxygen-independent coproporphyrinogen III oxidase
MGRAAEGLDLAPPESLYVHVPVCASKCAYCDFFSVPSSSLSDAFARALVEATIARAADLAERFGAGRINTVYIGGGTPTSLGAEAFDRLLEGIAALAPSPIEWTVEANPESLDLGRVEAMIRRGVTRVSIGAQSMDARSLEVLGRPHGWKDTIRAARLAAESGMELSVDLIAGIPRRRGDGSEGRRKSSLAEAARELIGAGAGHLSAYDLTVEEGTPLAAERDLDYPGEDESWEERSGLESAAAEAGFRRYEVSNYAPRGLECRHNLAYWRMDSYIGAGPGAVSTLVARAHPGAMPGRDGSSLRIEESKKLGSYPGDSSAAAAETVVAPRESAFEAMMMAFRTGFGLDLGRFESRFGVDARKLIGGTFASWGSMLSPGEPWPGEGASRGPALDGRGLDLLNRFLGDCLEEMDSTYPSSSGGGERG